MTADYKYGPSLNKKCYRLFYGGLLMVFVAVILGVTPIHWNLIGHPDEMYPELFWLFIAAPAAAVVTFVGLILGFHIEKKKKF